MDLNTFINDLYDSGDLFLEERDFLREVQALMLLSATELEIDGKVFDRHDNPNRGLYEKLRTLAGKVDA